VDELEASQWLVEIWLADYEAVLELGSFETSTVSTDITETDVSESG
jgi:hypothetical protein